jgi:uncharacterized protein (DUF302 family)
MKKITTLFVLLLGTTGAYADDGMIRVESAHDVKTTADRLEAALNEKGMNVFGRVNHAAGAEKAGMELRPTELVIFGNPKVGTPLMQCAHSVAIDLPQKALVWEDEEGKVWLAYNDPQYLKTRHAIEGCDEVIGKVSGALGNFAKAAAAP